jgi:septum formation protein
MGVDFQVIPSDIQEVHPEGLAPFLVPEHLASQKADEVFARLERPEQTIVIGADSVVILNGKIFEKPSDASDAFRMLSHLSGRTHTVVTGVALISSYNKMTFSAKTEVTFRPMDKDEIEMYIEEYKPFDKAGAYGVQDWMGMCKVSELQGTYTNVMGLPTDLVYEGLKAMVR